MLRRSILFKQNSILGFYIRYNHNLEYSETIDCHNVNYFLQPFVDAFLDNL